MSPMNARALSLLSVAGVGRCLQAHAGGPRCRQRGGGGRRRGGLHRRNLRRRSVHNPDVRLLLNRSCPAAHCVGNVQGFELHVFSKCLLPACIWLSASSASAFPPHRSRGGVRPAGGRGGSGAAAAPAGAHQLAGRAAGRPCGGRAAGVGRPAGIVRMAPGLGLRRSPHSSSMTDSTGQDTNDALVKCVQSQCTCFHFLTNAALPRRQAAVYVHSAAGIGSIFSCGIEIYWRRLCRITRACLRC